jgi:DNA-binding MarR family transcriptional regulator
MTEDKPEYVTDALEMIGANKPKEIVHEISGFTPLFDVLVEKYSDPITPLVFGKAWRFCQMADGVCKASLSTIGEELGLDESTISRHLKILVTDGYLLDLTPDLRNRPHVYAETGRIVMRTSTNAGLAHSKAEPQTVAQSNVGVAHSKATVAQNAMTKVLKKDIEETDTAVLFRGDHREYPDRLWDWALALRDEWLFTLPPKPRKNEGKSKYGFWIMAMDDLKSAAGEFGLSALDEIRGEFESYMASHGGVAPFTVSGPQSLLNVMSAKVAQMRSTANLPMERSFNL